MVNGLPRLRRAVSFVDAPDDHADRLLRREIMGHEGFQPLLVDAEAERHRRLDTDIPRCRV